MVSLNGIDKSLKWSTTWFWECDVDVGDRLDPLHGIAFK